MPKLLAAGPGTRIVNVSSSAARHRTHSGFEDYNFSNGDTYTAFDGYIQAKLALFYFSIALAKRMEKHHMQAYSLHPGSIISEMRANVASDDWQASEKRRAEAGTKLEGIRKKTVEEGCATILVAALDPRIAHQNGAYLNDGAIATKNIPVVGDSIGESSEKLWKVTEQLLERAFSWP
jgi:NAD(P)-dependent dehydrogenase (short-subunit alcohol dehydrogenase family)